MSFRTVKLHIHIILHNPELFQKPFHPPLTLVPSYSCWLKNDIAFYVAVVAYFCVIFLFNVIMFIVVLVQLCRIKRQNPHNSHHRTTLQDARSVAGITILLGLTWGFAFFAWGPVNLAFMYLFAIFNSLQGEFSYLGLGKVGPIHCMIQCWVNFTRKKACFDLVQVLFTQNYDMVTFCFNPFSLSAIFYKLMSQFVGDSK